MDDAPYTGDLDLGAVTTRDELVALLQEVHVRADKPSLRSLAARTRHEATPLSKSTVSGMLSGVRFPRKAVMIAFLRACGVPNDGMESWRRAWERVVSGEEGPARLKVTPAAPGRPPTEITASADPSEAGQVRGEADRPVRQSMWHFPGDSRIILVSYRLPPDRRPPSSDPDSLNYVRFSDLADLDALIEIHGAIRSYNPTSQVTIMAAQDLHQPDVANHIVLIGGLAWKAVTPWFSHIFPIPIEAGDPFDRGAIVVRDPDSEEHEFKYTLNGNEIVEDIGFLVCGKNPSAPRRTLTICGGITTRGVHGAALCFIDPEMRERNEQYLSSRFPAGSTSCVVMRVPIINRDPSTPDLSKKENRLFEWSDGDSEAR